MRKKPENQINLMAISMGKEEKKRKEEKFSTADTKRKKRTLKKWRKHFTTNDMFIM